VPNVFFIGHRVPDYPAHQSDEGGDRRREPFVIAKCRQTDQRPSQKPHHVSSDQPHEERSFEREIEERVTEQAQDNAHREWRRHEEKHQHLLLGVSLLGKQDAAEGAKTDQQGCQRRRKPDFQHQRKQQLLAAVDCFSGNAAYHHGDGRVAP
jgi:hypothetical protein